MAFICRQCGTCCMFMGDYIAIDRQAGPFEYECQSVSTGTTFHAIVDPDKRDLFEDREWISRHTHACGFLRPAGDGRIVCTIHESNAAQCKVYRCVVMKIFSRSGILSGTVTGTLALHSEDPDLRAAWDDIERETDVRGPGAEELISGYLKKKGYRVV